MAGATQMTATPMESYLVKDPGWPLPVWVVVDGGQLDCVVHGKVGCPHVEACMEQHLARAAKSSSRRAR